MTPAHISLLRAAIALQLAVLEHEAATDMTEKRQAIRSAILCQNEITEHMVNLRRQTTAT
jgi:hypothetical protein